MSQGETRARKTFIYMLCWAAVYGWRCIPMGHGEHSIISILYEAKFNSMYVLEWGVKFPWAMENTLADVKRKKERINFLKLIIINIIVGVGFGKAKAFFLQTTFLPSSFLFLSWVNPNLTLNLNGILLLAYRYHCHYQLLYLSIYRLFVLWN